MSYLRLLSRLYNTPLAVSEDKLDIITSEVTLKLLAGEALSEKVEAEHKELPKGIAVVNIFDGLTAKNGGGSAASTSYEGIKSQTLGLIAKGHQKIYFNFDTPGGEVAGLFGTSEFLASLPKTHGVETVGIVDGQMASAGYVLGSSMQKLYATESSIIGSIGVIATVMNVTKADEEAGKEYKILRSKGEKAKLNPHEPFDASAIENLQGIINTLDTQMNSLVTGFRPTLSLDTVMKLNGKVVLGQEALALGLIDGIVTSFEEVIDKDDDILSTTNHTGTIMTLEEAQAQIIGLSSEVATLKASVDVAKTAATTEERARILGVLKAQEILGLDSAIALKSINSGRSVEDATEMFEQIAEGIGAKPSIDTTQDTSTINSKTTDEGNSFSKSLDAALEAQPKDKLFAGVM